jgi:hypothetical protein
MSASIGFPHGLLLVDLLLLVLEAEIFQGLPFLQLHPLELLEACVEFRLLELETLCDLPGVKGENQVTLFDRFAFRCHERDRVPENALDGRAADKKGCCGLELSGGVDLDIKGGLDDLDNAGFACAGAGRKQERTREHHRHGRRWDGAKSR